MNINSICAIVVTYNSGKSYAKNFDAIKGQLKKIIIACEMWFWIAHRHEIRFTFLVKQKKKKFICKLFVCVSDFTSK